MDAMVLKTQEWLNATYGGDSRYNIIDPADGITGWKTIYALTRALQIELGITATADSFGPTTKSKFTAKYPNGVQQQASGATIEDNIYAIIQGALWCKGYSTGANEITRHFYSGTGGAVTALKTDAGMLSPNSTVTLNVMIALLSMNQYVPIYSQGGTDEIRSIQQRLNRKYESYIGLAPCDGLYGRDMNKALIIALQAVEGLTVAQATGNFGDTTKNLLPLLPDTANVLAAQKEADAIDLLKYALCCNGYSTSLSNSTWDSNVIASLSEFQADMMLPVTGAADVNTWMALLLSKGNPDRSASACDTRFEMTTDRIAQLLGSGYQIVGRYLTGTDFKVLRADEPQRILSNGLKFFPIFQESTTDITYFTPARGIADANKAVRAARNFRIPEGTVLFFAVDLDPLGPDITNYILPYFKSLSENMDEAFKIGVYGTRNVCNQVNDKGYADTSFVSDMSTGYSGNMGFKMPKDWTYDQFSEISMSPDWGIDKVTYSGKFPPVTALETYVYQKPPKPSNAGLNTIFDLVSTIQEVESLYQVYYDLLKGIDGNFADLNAITAAAGVCNYLRSFNYGGTQWDITTMNPIDHDFVDFVHDLKPDIHSALDEYIHGNNVTLLSDGGNGLLDLAHLAATTECYLNYGSPLVPNHWTGWGGDLATGMADTTNQYNANPNASLQQIADSIVGSENYSCKYSDICTDADAMKIAPLAENSTDITHAFTSALVDYYTNYVQNRYLYYLADLGGKNNLTALKSAIHDKMTGLGEDQVLLPTKGNNPSGDVINACCSALANYIYSELA